jgi:hypothetical protein
MDALKANWPKIAVASVAAVGLAFLISRSSKDNVSLVVDLDREEEAVSAKEWPCTRRIVSLKQSLAT